MVNPTNMKELCEYVKQSRRSRAAEHRRKHQHDGLCRGLTDKEYFKVKHTQKSSFSKARKFTHNRMWRETGKEYSVEQLKAIKNA